MQVVAGGPAAAAAASRADGVDCDLHEALLMSNLRDGDRLVLYSRWAVDERLPVAERKEFTPTPKQMLYGQRAELLRIVATKKDEAGRVTEAFAEVELKESRGGDWSKPFVFPAINRPLEDGKLYTLDPCPNEWYAYWCSQVVDGLCAGSAEHPVRPAGHAPAARRRRRVAGPDRRSWPGWTPSGRPGCCTTSRPASGSSSAATPGRRCCWSRDRPAPERAIARPSPSSPGCKGRCRRGDRTGSSCPARPTQRRTFC